MFSLIIAIVSIALIVALVALGGYFGGDAVSDAQAQTQAARLISEERQILASMDMFQADNKRWPSTLDELVSTGYLRSRPQGANMVPQVADTRFGLEFISSAHADVVAALGWNMPAASTPIIYTVQVPQATCRAYNKAERGDNGILRQAFEVLPAQCYGVDGDYRVVVKKVGANINLTGVLDSSVEAGNLPTKENDDWWDVAPDAAVQAPTDPVKTPKAELSLTGTALSFGQVQLGQAQKSSAITLANRGKVAAQTVAVSAPEGFDLVDNTCGTQLNAGSSCSFAIGFAPVVAKAYIGDVTVSASNGASVRVPASGEGVGASMRFTGINFGDVLTGSDVWGDAVLQNTGVGPLRLGSAVVTGPGFSLLSSTCGTTLPAGASCAVKVNLHALDFTAHTGGVSVASQELGDLSASLAGQSRKARVAIDVQSYAFGNVQLAESPSGVVHTVSSTGNLDVTGMTVVASDGYTLKNNTCLAALPVGSTCSFSVTFKPTEARDYPGAVVVTPGNAGGAQVSLTGKGWLASGTLTDITFPAASSGTTTDLVSILTNTGKGPLTVTAPTSAAVTGTGFSFVSTTCPASVAVGANCTITVRFTAPATLNSYTGALKVTTGAGLLSAQLTGTSADVITFTIGAAGVGGIGATDGTSGGSTTVNFKGSTMLAGAGSAGRYNAGGGNGGGVGGTGVVNESGGQAGSTSGNQGGSGGAGICAGSSIDLTGAALGNSAWGGNGGVATGCTSGIAVAVPKAGYAWNQPGSGSRTFTVGGYNNGTSATGFGAGAGGGSSSGGNGGSAVFGGGGGGASGGSAALPMNGGNGGAGAVVVLFTDSTAILIASGTSYAVPTGKTVKQVWGLGGGGGGGGAVLDSTAGSGGGAGGLASKSF